MAQFECPQCGAPLSPDMTQCPYCGENVQPAQSAYQQPNQETYQQPQPNMYQQPNPNTYQQPQPQPQPNMYQQPNQTTYQQPNQTYYQQPQPNMYQQQMPQNYNPYGSQPMYQNGYPYPYEPGVNPAWPIKNKIVAGVLAICLGVFGIHKFYLGKSGLGILYLLFFWTGIPAILGLIEGILYLCSDDHNFQIKQQVRLH